MKRPRPSFIREAAARSPPAAPVLSYSDSSRFCNTSPTSPVPAQGGSKTNGGKPRPHISEMLCRRSEAQKLKGQMTHTGNSPSGTDSAFLELVPAQPVKKTQPSLRRPFSAGVLECAAGGCARVGVGAGRRRGLPGTPKSFNQAFRGAGRSQDLVKHSSESQSRAPDKAKTRLLGVMLSTLSLKFPLGAQARSSCNSRQRWGKKKLAIRGSKWHETGVLSLSQWRPRAGVVCGPAGRPTHWRHRPRPHGLRLTAAHYLPGCRYWCVNMLSSLSNQPALFLSSFALL